MIYFVKKKKLCNPQKLKFKTGEYIFFKFVITNKKKN